MTYADHLDGLGATNPALAATVAGWRNLENILKRCGEAGGSLRSADLVQQDEYSYDFLLPLADRRWLSFSIS